jgi:threonine/homoserine/homoserine lactone efflux protein
VLVLAMRPLADAMRRPAVTRMLDGLTGAVLVAFGIRLALEQRG